MTNLDFEWLRSAVANDAAIRRVQRLQPAGGPGDKIFPPTYPGERTNDAARHLFETRRINGADVRCVLIDSVQSQANRLEDALLTGIRASRFAMPHIVVDFTGLHSPNGIALSDLGQITSLDAPHRVFDAIIRDSELDGVKFTETHHYEQLLLAKPTNALPAFVLSPTSLVFGAWHSTGEGGGVGAKFARCIVSEIVGVGVADGQKGAVRIDPLGIRASVKVVGGPLDWTIATGAKGEKSARPSEVNHSNIISNLVPGGVTIDYARHIAVITCAGLRRLRFPDIRDETAGRSVLAALALVALVEQERSGYALRSRCDLVCDGRASFEIVHPDGSTESFDVDADGCLSLLNQSVEAAKAAGFTWNPEPIRLRPQPRLVELVALSRAKALAGESEGENA
jgi:CRISPR-associated protein Csb1